MLKLSRKHIATAVGVLLMVVLTAVPAMAQFDELQAPGNPAFARTWERTDKPVADGQVERTWIWGEAAFSDVITEPYEQSPNGERQVQYFDKSRMEINNPEAQDDALWYVTNGLLVVELVTGDMQVGDEQFVEREPADVQIAGDPNQMFGPTYADIHDLGLRSVEATPEGAVITRELAGDNSIAPNSSYDQYGVTAAERVQVPGIDHTVASPFWDFMNQTSLVYENGEFVQDLLFENPFYATGYPITEAYWSMVPVGGTEQAVLWQCFERRCLTFTPANEPGWQVEAANVGQHYYTWRYLQEPEEPEEPETTSYTILFGSMNGSGVSAEGSMTLAGDQLTVQIDASGTAGEEIHPQHIHRPENAAAVCPTPAADADEDGLVSLEEGLPSYGPPIVPLFVDAEAEAYPTADAEGAYSFEQTFTVDPDVDLTSTVVALHGMTVDEAYDASLPIACGQVFLADEVPAAETTAFQLNELNESGVTGTADVSLTGQILTVMIEATGFEEGAHPQHMHGLEADMSTCPMPDADDDEDGIVSLEEGLPFYGGVIVPFAPYPTVDAAGELSYTQSYIVDPETISVATRAIVLHGLTVDTEYDPSVPVACGSQEVAEEAPEYEADLTAAEGVTTEATGHFTLDIADDGESATFTLTAQDIENVTAAHIHLTDTQEVVVPLFLTGDESEWFSGEGEIASGEITQDMLTGALEGGTISDLVDQVDADNTYVNVHTDANPSGEINGQIVPAS